MFERLPLPLSTLVLLLGAASTLWGFANYNDPILNLVGIFTGIPVLLGGLTMRVVELKPVPALKPATAEIDQARTEQITTIQAQVRADITKYNYGANAHMEDALEFLGLRGPTEADLPKLVGYQDQLRDGRYTLLLRFSSPAVSYETWQSSHRLKMQGFFGKDVDVDLSQPQETLVDLALVAVGSTDPDQDPIQNNVQNSAQNEATQSDGSAIADA